MALPAGRYGRLFHWDAFLLFKNMPKKLSLQVFSLCERQLLYF
ncbi:hypothetical protein SD77_2172 [Bacillus badius]|uniref:Uncharacterized protein n=1 Tax=Bacillus badius TaxID=1455 RepID=A0ABR5AY98_BACBA|nr:hypothetical protein SD78_2363 [Bacillus badius]KIL79718.1 hypothetical protein SD77_2172 [Bacillus badius]